MLGVTVKDGTCYVNLDNGFLTQTYNVSAEVQIYSIVNSLVELSNINKVQIAVNGNTDMIFREKILHCLTCLTGTLIWFTKRRNYNHKNCRRPLCAAILIFLTLYLAARLLPEWVGTDAGTDTSEKAPIGGRTSLTQLDTWLEAMDGETLCLTGKSHRLLAACRWSAGKRQLSFKRPFYRGRCLIFCFSGDSAETTDNLSQISGSADADQMSILISSQKTISQINEMQEIFGKKRECVVLFGENEALPKAGSYVRVFGEVSPFLLATNPGEFDTAAYYRRKDCLFALRKKKLPLRQKLWTAGRISFTAAL